MKKLIVGIFVCILASCSENSFDSSSAGDGFGELRQLSTTTPVPDVLHGVWQSKGYGWIFDISEDGLTQFQIAGDICFEAPEDSLSLTDTLALSYQYYRLGPNDDRAILQLLPEDTEIHIERIDNLPTACAQPIDTSYEGVFEYYATLIGSHYAFFDERNIDWISRVMTARSELSNVETDLEFFDLLAGMIDGFSDSHTKLIGVVDGKGRRQQDGLGPTLSYVRLNGLETPWLIDIFGSMQTEILDLGSLHTANDRILWGTIDDGRVGYIQILQMGGFSGVDISDPEFRQAEFDVFDGVMNEALVEMSDSEFVILDLSNNRGGYDAISRRVASRFASETFDAYTTEIPGSGVPARTRSVEPAMGVRFEGPVVLLTSDVTVSGGEISTLALRQLPNVVHVGGTTRGSFSTVLSKPLPSGWVVELANEVIAAPDGTVFEETGIEPEIALDVFPEGDPIGGHRQAIQWILANYPFDTDAQ